MITRASVNIDGSTAMDRLARNQTKNYFAAITGVDEQFGRILRALDDLNLKDDTIVVFTSDHGNCLGAHQEISKNVPWEESMRVPLLIRWPGHIDPRRDELLWSTPDFAPTLLTLMGLGNNLPEGVQGTSHAPLFLSGRGARPTSQLYMKVPAGQPSRGRRGVRTDRHTLVVSRVPGEAERIELYDRLPDPSQLQDLVERQPDVARRLLRDELTPWLERTRDPWLRPSCAS